MDAPERFAEWMTHHVANDQKFGRRIFHYHPRSDEHSKTLCALVLADLLRVSPALSAHLQAGETVAGINASMTFRSGKVKTLDLAVGEPSIPQEPGLLPISGVRLKKLRISCEAKQCMTEHSKSKPRIFDELSSSHEIVHQGDKQAIAAGIVVVNIAGQFASPTRQTSPEGPPVITVHRQPDVTESLIEHLNGLVMRSRSRRVGFDALAIVVVDCDNLGPCRLHTGHPAPQPGDRHHYATFLSDIAAAYLNRFA